MIMDAITMLFIRRWLGNKAYIKMVVADLVPLRMMFRHLRQICIAVVHTADNLGWGGLQELHQ